MEKGRREEGEEERKKNENGLNFSRVNNHDYLYAVYLLSLYFTPAIIISFISFY